MQVMWGNDREVPVSTRQDRIPERANPYCEKLTWQLFMPVATGPIRVPEADVSSVVIRQFSGDSGA
jgi:hypothetical protein